VLSLSSGCVCAPVDRELPPRVQPPRVQPSTEKVALPSPSEAKVEPPVAAPAPEPASPSGDRLDAGERITASPAALVVDDPGASERAVLRIAGKVGDVHALELRLAMAVTMELGTRRVPATDVPAMDLSLRAEVTAVDATHTTLAVSVTGVEVGAIDGATARVRGAVERTATRLRAATGTLRVSHDGRQIELQHAAGAADAAAGILEPELGGLAAAWQELMPALPSSAVGEGARWHGVRHVRRDTVELEQRGQWTLEDVVDGTSTLALESSHTATVAEVAPASLVKAQRGTTTAQIVIDGGPVPRRATATVTTTTRASLGPLGADGEAAVRTTLTLALSREA
jgi:hypothetical protein